MNPNASLDEICNVLLPRTQAFLRSQFNRLHQDTSVGVFLRDAWLLKHQVVWNKCDPKYLWAERREFLMRTMDPDFESKVVPNGYEDGYNTLPGDMQKYAEANRIANRFATLHMMLYMDNDHGNWSMAFIKSNTIKVFKEILRSFNIPEENIPPVDIMEEILNTRFFTHLSGFLISQGNSEFYLINPY